MFSRKTLQKKIIYIESFAKTTSKTKTGQLMYYIADRFYIQWESLQMLYPKGIYKGESIDFFNSRVSKISI
ncbi:hypothetical protein GQR36_05435 [Enterococcus termitis]